MPKVLGQFSITQEADGYVLHLEDEDGDTTEFSASEEQLDEITEAIQDQLDMAEEGALALDDDGDEVDEADDE